MTQKFCILSGLYWGSPLGLRPYRKTSFELTYGVSIALDSDRVIDTQPTYVSYYSTMVDCVSVNWTAIDIRQGSSAIRYFEGQHIRVNEDHDAGQKSNLTGGFGASSAIALSAETLASHERTTDLVNIGKGDITYYADYNPQIDPRLTKQNQHLKFDFRDSENSLLGWVEGEGSTDFRLGNSIRIVTKNDQNIRFF